MNRASWIWRPSFERQRDFNPPEQRAAQHALPVCRRSARFERWQLARQLPLLEESLAATKEHAVGATISSAFAQLGVLGFGLSIDGKIGVGVFPNAKQTLNKPVPPRSTSPPTPLP